MTLTEHLKLMSKSLEELLLLVNKSNLSSLKTTLVKLIEVIHNPDSSVTDLKNLIEIDPPLSANVLRRANSALYGMRRGVASIMDAIIFVGFDAIVELTLNQKFFELSQDNGRKTYGYSRTALWEHCIGVALCGKLLYRREFRKSGGGVYTAGLLHDIGIIVEDKFLHDEFISILATKEKTESDLLSAEREVLGYCHQDIGKMLAENWNFPEELCRVIGMAESSEAGDADPALLMADTIYVSNCACQLRKVGFSETSRIDVPAYEFRLNRLQIKGRALEIIMDEVEAQIAQMKKDGWF